MRILYLTFYYEPDLCAGSFRNTTLVKELSSILSNNDQIHVVTTMPNRYSSYLEKSSLYEEIGNIRINRIQLPLHKSGLMDQSIAFKTYFIQAIKITNNSEYDLIFASSSRLFTALLGSVISKRKKIPYYIDVRDIFTDTIQDIIKNPLYKHSILGILKFIEKYAFNQATHINLISEGFNTYFRKFKNSTYSYFTNGIDTEFDKMPPINAPCGEEIIITYAGNIGEGQGLHKIIPEAAKLLGSKYRFRIIGDGGKKGELVKELLKNQITNVDLLPPTSRSEIINFYNQSHFLFLHLNDYHALEKVLPSKIFEYGATNKPIIAGVSGFSAQFIKNNLTNFILFTPGNAKELVYHLGNFEYHQHERKHFKEEFGREYINEKMAQSIVQCLSQSKNKNK